MRVPSSWRFGALVLLSCILLLVPWPFRPSIWFGVCEDAGHAVFFGLAAVLAWKCLPDNRTGRQVARRYLNIWSLVTLAGALVEVAQYFTGRDPAWLDLVNDGLGAGIALALLAARHREVVLKTRVARVLVAGSVICAGLIVLAPPLLAAAAYWHRNQQLPVLWAYDSPLDDYFIRLSRAAYRPADRATCAAIVSSGPKALRFALDAPEYPGFHLREPYPDWRGYQALALTINNPGATALALTVRVNDSQHRNQYEDRFNRQFLVPPGLRTFTVPMEDIERGPVGRQLGMGQLADVMVFSAVRMPGAAFCVVQVSLVP